MIHNRFIHVVSILVDFWRKDDATVFIFKCKDCDKQFLDIEHLWDHMEFSHDEVGISCLVLEYFKEKDAL